jgi:mono/diheme cytochrome c family protein
MNVRLYISVFLVFTLAAVGCGTAPGKPKPGLEREAIRPDRVTDFATLYSKNCAACHGDHGKHGAAISLANPLYLAFAGAQNLQHVITAGVPGTMMPGFAKSAGGMLTDQQVTILTQGMIQAWGDLAAFKSQSLPAYVSSKVPDAKHGQSAFGVYCGSCHGTDGAGVSGRRYPGSLADPAYLSLVSDQGLRTILIAGKPEEGMPDYRSYKGHALTDQEITDIVAWLASNRTATPGQVYKQHP